MLFNSYHFLIFFPIVTTAYFLLPFRFRWILLLAASYYFYMAWEPVYAVLLISSTIVDYFVGILLGRTQTKRLRLIYLCLSIAVNLGFLFFFKYYDFFGSALGGALGYFSLPFHLTETHFLLPVGISFYTFKELSYTFEIYMGRFKPEKHFGIFALYVAYFPQLVAGPIERPYNLIHQLKENFTFDYARVTDGLKLMAWGMFKKVAIADRLAIMVDTIYGNPRNHEGPSLVIATIFFAFQIYCDFSGYSDIAIGAAKIMGINLMINFKRPYFAKSVTEFWRRWHISLSSWFRDYLYIPLGGNRVSIPRWYLNILIVFFLSGLWHGANWTFIIWGLLHGFYIMASRLLHKPTSWIIKTIHLDKTPTLLKTIQVLITFILVSFGWIFFRAENLSDATHIVTHLSNGWHSLSNIAGIKSVFSEFGVTKVQFLLGWGLIIFLIYVQMIQRKKSIRLILSEKPSWLRWSVYYALLIALLLFGVFTENQFIYFQF